MEFKGKNEEYYAGLDKRSKEYRDYKEFLASSPDEAAKNDMPEEILKDSDVIIENDSDDNIVFTVADTYDIPAASDGHGLGDKVEKILEATGIKKLVTWMNSGKDCGCDERKSLLNMWSYKGLEPECMIKSEYEWMQEYMERHNKNKYSATDVFLLHKTHTRIFRASPKVCSSCNSSVISMQQMVKRLEGVMKIYQEELEA